MTQISMERMDRVTIPPYAGDVGTLREVFGAFPSGLAAISAMVEGEPQVLVASSFSVGVSQDPPLTLFSVQHSSTTWPILSNASMLGISVLGSSHAQLCRQLAAKDRGSRFDGVETFITENGAILFEDSTIWMECTVEHQYAAGDHDIIVLRVHGMTASAAHAPLVFHQSSFRVLA